MKSLYITAWILPLACQGFSIEATLQRLSSIRRVSSSCLFKGKTDDTGWASPLIAALEEEEVEGLDSLQVQSDPSTNLRGLYTTIDWNTGEYLCAFPFTAAIVVQESVSNSTDKDDRDVEMAMICEDVENGLAFLKISNLEKYQSYVQGLPRVESITFDATPDYWTPAQLDQIPVAKMRDAANLRNELIHKVAAKHHVNPSDLRWATWIIRTRGFSTFRVCENDDGTKSVRKRKLLLPFLDLMNHDAVEFNCIMDVLETKEDYTSMYALQATRPITAGEPVTICYGTGCETSLELLDMYGFWLPEEAEGGDYCYSNPSNANLDWSLVDQVWKDQVKQKAETHIDENTNSNEGDKASCFNQHFELLYKKAIRSGFDV
mmetsp:Transcript_3597/g.4767  ORF Transcript_3597/g.4767 Transcript_3597/m.4767 type:complete len:376 (+) Transcript_3597:156-1283(+)